MSVEGAVAGVTLRHAQVASAILRRQALQELIRQTATFNTFSITAAATVPISSTSALGVLNDYALYNATHALTHSLTHSRKLKQFEKIHIIIDMFVYTVTIAIYVLLKSITTPTSKNPR